jgi:hypothetical protein
MVGVNVAIVDWFQTLMDVCATTKSKAIQVLVEVAQEKEVNPTQGR